MFKYTNDDYKEIWSHASPTEPKQIFKNKGLPTHGLYGDNVCLIRPIVYAHRQSRVTFAKGDAMKKKIVWIVLAPAVLALLYIAMPKVRHIETEDTAPDTQDHELNIGTNAAAESPKSETHNQPEEPAAPAVEADAVKRPDLKEKHGSAPAQP